MQPEQALLEQHYGELKDKPFFPGLVKFMATSPVVCMVSTVLNYSVVNDCLSPFFALVLGVGRSWCGENWQADARRD